MNLHSLHYIFHMGKKKLDYEISNQINEILNLDLAN